MRKTKVLHLAKWHLMMSRRERKNHKSHYLQKEDFCLANRSLKKRRNFEKSLYRITTDQWTWCYGNDWLSVDSTQKSIAKRMFWLVFNGLPKNWFDQMTGKTKLCYK